MNRGSSREAGPLKGARPVGVVIDEMPEFEAEPVLSVFHAEIIAMALHARQKDKAGEPYWKHLMQVATLVRGLGGDDHDVISAWFHDAVEDGHATFDGLRAFGVSDTSLDTINAVTKIKGEPNEASLLRVRITGPRAQRLKLADLLSNTRHDRVAVLREQAAGDEKALDKIDRRLATYQRWIQTLMVDLELLPAEVGYPLPDHGGRS